MVGLGLKKCLFFSPQKAKLYISELSWWEQDHCGAKTALLRGWDVVLTPSVRIMGIC